MKTFVPVGKRSWQPVKKQRTAGSIPDGNLYYNFEFSLVCISSQLGGDHANEINHDHLSELCVVLRPNV